MKMAAVFALLLTLWVPASAGMVQHQVKRNSDLERMLAYKLSVRDKHDVWRSEGLEKIFPIKGPAPEFIVQFDATTTGKLKELFGLTLTLKDADGLLVQVPLQSRWVFSPEGVVSVQFLIKKSLIGRAVLTLRCGEPAGEESYEIQLGDYAPSPDVPTLKGIPGSGTYLRLEVHEHSHPCVFIAKTDESVPLANLVMELEFEDGSKMKVSCRAIYNTHCATQRAKPMNSVSMDGRHGYGGLVGFNDAKYQAAEIEMKLDGQIHDNETIYQVNVPTIRVPTRIRVEGIVCTLKVAAQ